ncbi:MAG: hypothetical protein PHN39_01455, partial [Candidatus Pacebacteria bacterium]|nr:hypothetical protein [Candidatus Paceibacterota bacterium]
MKISYVYDEGPRKEDNYLIKDNLAGVFDGANSRTNFIDQQGLSGGQLAAQIVKDTFALDDRSLQDLAILANQNLKSQMMAHGVDTND